jgi:uncharacterized cupin superfamily protein
MTIPVTAALRLLAGDKEPVRLATTANITLSGLQTIDGVVTVAGDRVLVKDQTDAIENGIYTASAGTWRRAADSATYRTMVAGMKVTVREGTAHGGDVWSLGTHLPNIGTDDIEWDFFISNTTLDEINATVETFTDTANDILGTLYASTSAATYPSRASAMLVTVPVALAYLMTAGYATAGDGGGALYKRVGSEPSHNGKFQDASGAWFELAESRVYPEMFGAVSTTGATQSNGVQTANVTAFQNALDFAKQIYLRDILGRYDLNGRLAFKADYYGIIGANQGLVQLNYTGTTSGFIYNDDNTTETRLWCRLENFRITAPGLTTSGDIVINWKSFQFGRIKNVWATASSNSGVIVLELAAEWTVTECTYNIVEGCYIGLCSIGIRIQDGANSNRIRANRIQPSVSGGSGISIVGSAAGRVSDISIIGNGFEYPGNISNGVNVFSGADNIYIKSNRFEALSSGIIVTSTNVTNVSAVEEPENYFSSCTTKVNFSGANGAQPLPVASGAVAGASGAFVDKKFNLTCTRNGTGDYTFTFVTARPNANYKVALSIVGSGVAYINSQGTTLFQVLCRDLTSLATAATAFDPTMVQVTVFDNV